MAFILNIDSSTEKAGVYLGRDNECLATRENSKQADHAAWIQPAIRDLLQECSITLKDLDAVAVTAGPGSYTGLRVGMATAKGLCYALDIPLITESTLKLMAASALDNGVKTPQLAPMIDARRMEVFTAVYDSNLVLMSEPVAMILEMSSFDHFLEKGEVGFFGSGSTKWKEKVQNREAKFFEVSIEGKSFVKLTYEKFLKGEFTVLAYAEPVYLKEFYIHPK